MAHLLHIYISPKEGVSRAQVEAKLNLGLDWYRYAPNLYVVHTSSSVDKWKARLIDFIKPGGRLLILRLDASQRQGWMNKDFWEWLREKSKAV
jgi:hypothetical protein